MKSFLPLLTAAFALVGTAALADDAVPKGTITTSRTTPDAVLIWDATPTLADLNAAHLSNDDKLRTLEADGAKIMRMRASGLTAGSIELRVIYAKTNMGAQYGDPTMDEKEKLVVLTAKRTDALASGAAWEKNLASGGKVTNLKVDVTGKLPS